MQPTLQRFFKPDDPDALKPALSVNEVKKSVGRQLSPRMAEIYTEVMGEAAESALKRMKLASPASSSAASPLNSPGARASPASPVSSSKDSVVRALSFELASPEAEREMVSAADQVRRKTGRPPGKGNYSKKNLEMPVAAKLKIVTELAASVEQHADSKSFWKETRQKYGMETRTLQKILSEKDELAA